MAPTEEREAIALIGMAGRFPGARDVRRLWDNLCAGKEGVRFFSEDELLAAGAAPELLADPRHVRAGAHADGLDRFDAGFFGATAREAELMDPQLRVALETVWEALEDAGLDPTRERDRVGLFMGASLSSYLVHNLLPNRELARRAGAERFLIFNDKDFYPTTISYRLDLRGPSVSVGTACSSSLVAVHLACQSLRAGECRVAVAGGSSVHVPWGRGYLHTKEGIYSADGRCRAFDAAASGTVGADGAAFVVLKRRTDALRDRDRVHALVLGSAVNNDGGAKAGYTAPSQDGQAAVIRAALRDAGVRAGEIGYVEAHGTGTLLGDPVELAALIDAFGEDAPRDGPCALGALKASVGHLDAAAGAAGLIKAALAVREGLLPPAVNFERPNPHVDLTHSPFFVNTSLRPWTASGPRRAGVSAFGVGGTNVHVVLGQTPETPAGAETARPMLFVVSARSERELALLVEGLRRDVDAGAGLADVEFTLACGRRHWPVRGAVVARERADLLRRLEAVAATTSAAQPRLAWLAPPALGTAVAVGAGLIAADARFRGATEECLDLLDDAVLRDALRVTLAGGPGAEGGPDRSAAAREVGAFVVQYGLGAMLLAWGVKPDVVLGVGVGELVAACLSGALSLSDGLALACRLGHEDAGARALLIKLSERNLAAILPPGVAVTAVCAPEVCVAVGPDDLLGALRPALARSGVATRWLPGRPPAPAPAAPALREGARVPWIRADTGTAWDGPRGGRDGDWDPTRPRKLKLGEAVKAAARENATWVELGDARALAALLRWNGLTSTERLAGLRSACGAAQQALEWAGHLWRRGADLDWRRLVENRQGRTCSLVTYPFQSTRHWVEAPAEAPVPGVTAGTPMSEQLQRSEQAALARQGPVRRVPLALSRALDGLVIDVIAAYFDSERVTPGGAWTLSALAHHLRVLPAFRRCLAWFVALLVEERLALFEGDQVRFTAPLGGRDRAEETCRSLRARFPEFRGLIEFVEHCARRTPVSLTTAHGGLQTLYPDGTDALIRGFVDDSARHGALPLCVETLCRWVAQEWLPARRGRVRILEVGMGGGILTWNLAPLLRGADVEYVATDVTRAMLTAAEKRARGEKLDLLRFQPYDLRRDPGQQGLAPGGFDLILALDVLHVVPRLLPALTHLRGLLAPGGLLGVIESTSTERWPNLVWGQSEAWWAFEDRESLPLMDAERWRATLRGAGFAEPLLAPSSGEGRADCVLLLAEGAASEAAPERPAPARRLETPPKRADIGTWMYAPVWRPAPMPPLSDTLPPGRILLFGSDEQAPAALAGALRALGHEVVIARRHALFARLGSRDYRLRPGEPADYVALLEGVLADGRLDGVVHAWTLRPPRPVDPLARLDDELTDGLHSLIFLMQALGHLNVAHALRLGVMTGNTQAVGGGELLRPEQATLKGAVKVIPQEYPNVRCVHVDLDLRQDLSDAAAARAATVATALDHAERFLALRDLNLLRLEFTSLPAPPVERLPQLREGGVYLITGGLGGVGLTLAEHLAREARARLVLVGRTGLPPRAAWDDLPDDGGGVAEQVRRIRRLEQLGAQVFVGSADLCDARRLGAVIAAAEARFGPIQGVIHTAAVADTAGVIQRRSRRATERALAAKVRGTLVLDALLRDHRLDFMVLSSALGATVYNLKFGEVGYVAANDFLNAYAHYLRSTRAVPAVTVSWTDWQDVGMAAEALKRLGQARDDHEELEHAFWERRTREGRRSHYRAEAHSGARWLFYGHRVGGRPTLPGTGLIELIGSAFCLDAGADACEIRNLTLSAPLAVDEWRRATVSLTLEPDAAGSRCALALTEDGRTRVFTSAYAQSLRDAPNSGLPIGAIQARCGRSERVASGARGAASSAIELDARWDVVREVWLGQGEGLARLELPVEFQDELRAFRWHPALLDGALAFLNHVLVGSAGSPHLPIGYERVRLHAPLEAVLYSHGVWRATSDRHGGALRFDFTIASASGRVLVEVEGLVARRAPDMARPAEPPPRENNHALAVGRPGVLPSLGFRPCAAQAPRAGEVEIEVAAAGLNFKEVLTALGLMGEGEQASFGLECAGRVARVGAGVAGLAAGDRVMAFGVRWTMPFASLPAAWVERAPEGLAFEAVATLPVAFTVAFHGLMRLARLRAGETVLIHAAAGGVGQAALQVARRAGASVIATAGTEAKREHLRGQGVERVSTSRGPEFAAEVLAWTGGRGVDVVLNSLAGELLDKSLEVLAPGGRFVELGRRDIAANRPVPLRLLAKGVQFFALLPDPGDAAFGASWREVGGLCRAGEFSPLPYRCYDAGRVVEAFEAMSRGEHVGKLVLLPGTTYPPVKEQRLREPQERDAVVRDLVQGMTSPEGVEAFRRALALDRPEVLVSTQDLAAMLEQQEIVSRGGHDAYWAARGATREPEARAEPAAATGAPELDIDAPLRAIWRDLLGTERIGADDDFFDLGGDSLVAVQLIARVKDAFDVEQTLAGIFETSGFAQMSASIRAARARRLGVA